MPEPTTKQVYQDYLKGRATLADVEARATKTLDAFFKTGREKPAGQK